MKLRLRLHPLEKPILPWSTFAELVATPDMDLLDARRITNDTRDVRLISLRHWQAARGIPDCDDGGPYAIVQEGYDPEDPRMAPDEFVLRKNGQWAPTSVFFSLSKEERQRDFIFPTAAGVMEVLAQLPTTPQVIRTGRAAEPQDADDQALARELHAGEVLIPSL